MLRYWLLFGTRTAGAGGGWGRAGQNSLASFGAQRSILTTTSKDGYQHFQGRGGFFNSRRLMWLAGGSAAGLGVYYWSCLETIPFTGRRHSLMFVSRSNEQAMGKMVFDMEREKARQMNALLPDNHPLSVLVRKAGMRVAEAASNKDTLPPGSSAGHMQGLTWDFAVVQSPIPNAFVVPGGKVVVYTGLLDLLSSEDEVAAILAHETAHVLARHHAEKMSTMSVWALARFAFYALFGFTVPQSVIVLGLALPYSRRAEYEADSIGLRLMAQACYDPGAAASMLQKLSAKEEQLSRGMHVPEFMRTHPLTETRVQSVQKQLPEVYRIYEMGGCHAKKQRLRNYQVWADSFREAS